MAEPAAGTHEQQVLLWRKDESGARRLTELQRSMFDSEDAFQEAIQFHLERGCELES